MPGKELEDFTKKYQLGSYLNCRQKPKQNWFLQSVVSRASSISGIANSTLFFPPAVFVPWVKGQTEMTTVSKT
jgi:hypothetical protein